MKKKSMWRDIKDYPFGDSCKVFLRMRYRVSKYPLYSVGYVYKGELYLDAHDYSVCKIEDIGHCSLMAVEYIDPDEIK